VWPYPETTAVYGPGVFRRDEAEVIEIRGSEQVTNADVKVDPSGLHSVRSRVLAGEDSHAPSQAMVRLRDSGGNVGKLVMTEEDGTFQIDNLPPGSYVLEVSGTDRAKANGTADIPQVSQLYQLAKVPLVINNRDEVLQDIFLTALKPGEKMDYPH
jgi:hypothetical protein